MTKEYPTHFSADWFTADADEWIRLLRDFPGRSVNALEIGSFEGRSAHWLLENLLTYPGSCLWCVDPWDGRDPCLGIKTSDAERMFDGNMLKFVRDSTVENRKFHKLKMESVTALTGFTTTGMRFDLVFIDGDHEGISALTDLVLSWPLVVPGGWLVFDDYGWESDKLRAQPRDAFDAWVSVKPPGVSHITSVGRLKFVHKKGA